MRNISDSSDWRKKYPDRMSSKVTQIKQVYMDFQATTFEFHFSTTLNGNMKADKRIKVLQYGRFLSQDCLKVSAYASY